MSSIPFTHHEILGLVEPFTRRGIRVDLAASDRRRRRLVFKTIEHAGIAPEAVAPARAPMLRESLVLENPDPGAYRLTRTLALPAGIEACLEAEGADPATLLAQVESVAAERQLGVGDGFAVARSHRLEPVPGRSAEADVPPRLVLTHAVAHVAGFALSLKVSRVSGIPAEIELIPPADAIELPQDLLAVLGLEWARLDRTARGWRSSVQLRGSEPQRSREAERKLERAVLHLARTLSEPPARFHQRFGAARWRVMLRRAVPLLGSLGLIAAACAVPSLPLEKDSVFRMLIFNAPPLLLVALFSMRELPRIEIPPWPRRLVAAAWRQSPASASAHDASR